MRAWLFSLAVLASSSVAWGQTNTLQIPDEVEVGEAIVARCDCQVPANGRLDVLWTVSDGVASVQCGDALHLWAKPGKHSVDAVIIPLRTITVQDQTFDVIAGPIMRLDAKFTVIGKVEPEPDPDPPGPDPPDPTDPPFPAPGLTILVIREAGAEAGMTPAQRLAVRSPEFLRWCQQNCVRVDSPTGAQTTAFRVWDDDYTDSQLSNTPAFLRDAYRAVLDGDVEPPLVAISDGQRGEVAQLPADLAGLMTLLRRYEP